MKVEKVLAVSFPFCRVTCVTLRKAIDVSYGQLKLI